VEGLPIQESSTPEPLLQYNDADMDDDDEEDDLPPHSKQKTGAKEPGSLQEENEKKRQVRYVARKISKSLILTDL
jgi:hypothetical protein